VLSNLNEMAAETDQNPADYVYMVAMAPAFVLTYRYAVRLSRDLELTGRLQGRSTTNSLFALLFLLNLILTIAICGALGIPLGMNAGAGAIEIALAGLIGLLLTLVLSFTATMAVRVLPQRRRAGPNRGANRLLAGLTTGVRLIVIALVGLFAIAVVGALVELVAGRWGPLGRTEYLALLILPAFLMFLFFYVRRGQRKAASFERRLRASPEESTVDRARVLYLRPFMEEHRLFAGTQTLEEFLGDEIAEQIGPLIALGNPTDRIAPEGAVRHYYEDDDWQQAVERLATQAPCIVAATSASPNTAWELRRVLELGLERRLYILSPPFREPPAQVATEGRIRRMLRTTRRVTFSWLAQDWDEVSRELSPGELPSSLSPAGQTTWGDLVNALAACGYTVDLPDPGAGAVVGFESGGRAVLLGSSASTAADFVRPIVDREPMAGPQTTVANRDGSGPDSGTRVAGKRAHSRPGGSVKESLDRLMADWSDDQLLEEYRALTADLPEGADRDGPTKSAITEEILRRGLSFPDVRPTPKSETVDWGGGAGGEDPGSGALPRPV
jgi:hypothetical protein